ncbi:MAG: hypothetical protein IPL61_27130 [Myxococcales bacterium]|nr:hypothetical protein [Myxococcales bacterium]
MGSLGHVLAAITGVGALVGCADRPGAADAGAVVDAAPPVPSRDHTYVISRIQMPRVAGEATAFGFDLDGVPGDDLDGIDNSFGGFLTTLRLPSGTAAVDTGIARGETIHLINLAAGDLLTPSPAGMWLFVGDPATATPAPCVTPSDINCRHHLEGTGQFSIADGTPTDPHLDGAVAGGVFQGGPGTLDLPLVLVEGHPPVTLTLHRARVQLDVVSAGVGSKIGGAITAVDFEAQIYPAVQEISTLAIERDCPMPRASPFCNCPSGSEGLGVIGLLDTAPYDCKVSPLEVARFMDRFQRPDLDLFDASGAPGSDGVNDSMSFGVGLQLVYATFPVP